MLALFLIGIWCALFSSLSPYLLKLMIDSALQNPKAVFHSNTAYYFVLFMLLWLSIATAYRTRDAVLLRLFPSVREAIIVQMTAYLNRHSYAYFQDQFAGSLANKISDMSAGGTTILGRLEELFVNGLLVVIALGFMLAVHPVFAGILLVWIITFVLISRFYTAKIQRLAEYFAASKTKLVGRMVDSISNSVTRILFSRNTHEEAYLHDYVSETVVKDREMQKGILSMRIAWDVSIFLLMGSTLLAVIILYTKGRVSIGDFTFVFTVANTIFHRLWNLTSQLTQFSEEVGKCKQALDVLTQPHGIEDTPNAEALIVKRGEIVFDQIAFWYEKNTRLFESQSLRIEAGSKVGLVGFSGAGKSSFVSLVLRCFDLKSGRILIDDQDIAQVQQDSLRSQISMIPQDPSLFHRSLMENIRYGDLNASDEQVIAASIKAHCHNFIMQLPQQYQSLVGERGVKLSGGQRQRIAIARAILKNAPILILDEATASLDSVTESQIQNSLEELMQGRTTLVIAHRISTLSKMDRILVFHEGKIIEDADHETLLGLKGHYARLWQMQSGCFLPC